MKNRKKIIKKYFIKYLFVILILCYFASTNHFLNITKTMNNEQKNEVREICLALVKNEVYMKLVNFISENKSEYHWQIDGDVALFVDFAEAKEFYAIFGNAYQIERLQVAFCDGYFAVDMNQIAECFDFSLEFLFEPKNE
jgi:hypothetical protein